MATKIISQKELVKAVSDHAGITQVAVKEVLDSLTPVVTNFVKEATDEEGIRVNIDAGIHVGAKLQKGSTIRPFSAEEITTRDKLKPFLHAGKCFKDAINE